MLKIAGFDNLQDDLSALAEFVADVSAMPIDLSYDPLDAASVELAVQEMRSAVDRKAARYRGNKAVLETAEKIKAGYELMIREGQSDS